MATFAELKAEIADDLATGSLTSQIDAAVKSAIRFYEGNRYAFNEKTATFSLVAGQEYYGYSDLADIPGIFAIDGLKVTADGTSYNVLEKTFAYIDGISTSTTTRGDPIYYAQYKKQIRFYPIPSQVRTVTVAYAYKATQLSADSDENMWTTDGYDLIKARAKADVYENTLRDNDSADRMRARANEIHNVLLAEYENRCGGKITPTVF